MFTLEQALKAIESKPEFGVYERPFGTAIDYNLMTNETFKSDNDFTRMILQNLRGTFFDHEGKIISLSYHKFHNVNENPEYALETFDFTEKHEIEEKLDGSMVRPVKQNGIIYLATRAGVTDVAKKANRALNSFPLEKKMQYYEFMHVSIATETTPIFEFCSREQQIVLDYGPQPRLVFTGLRCNKTGKYIPIKKELKVRYPLIEVVSSPVTEMSSMSQLVEYTRGLENAEGFVVKFASGRMVKIKADQYVRMHRVMDGLQFEKRVLELIIHNEIDDVLPLLSESKRAQVSAFRDSVVHHVQLKQAELEKVFKEIKVEGESQKDFALKALKFPELKGGLFALNQGKSFSYFDVVSTNLGSQSAVDSIRYVIGKSYYEF